MLYKKDVLMIDSDSKFVEKVERATEEKFNFLTTDTLETAFSYCGISPLKLEKPSNAIIEPSVIIFGDHIKVSDKFIHTVKEEIPQVHEQEAYSKFLPVYYSKLFSNYYSRNSSIPPSTCICVACSSYPFNGESTQDITKILGYCMENNIPLIEKNPEREKLIVTSLKELLNRKCSISKQNRR